MISITDGIHVIGPQYQKVSISTEIIPKSINDIAQIEEQASRLLMNFLHPTRGGIDEEGWDFGARIFIVDIVKILNRIEQIESIKKITVHKFKDKKSVETVHGSNQGWITLDDNSLPTVQDVKIIIKTN